MKTEVEYLNEKQVSQLIGLGLSTLRNARFCKTGIPYRKVGRSVRYRKEEVIAYMEGHMIKTEPI